jgi:hypothetical protein
MIPTLIIPRRKIKPKARRKINDIFLTGVISMVKLIAPRTSPSFA